MKAKDMRKAESLVKMANEHNALYENGIVYRVNTEVEPKRDGRSVWYPAVATKGDGETWDYWLAADSGSWKGGFLNGNSI